MSGGEAEAVISPDGQTAEFEGETHELPIRPNTGEPCTPALQRFLERHQQVFSFLFFTVELAGQSDRMARIASEALAKVGDKDAEERLKKLNENPDPTFKHLQSFARLHSENIAIRLSDNFVSYVSELLQSALAKRLELLRSDETVTISEVLRFKKFADLTAYLVDRKLNQLTYGGLKEIERFIKKRTNLEMFEAEQERTLLMLLVELRNIYTHNRGVVSDITLRRLHGLDHGFELVAGKQVVIGFDEVARLGNNAVRISRRLDAAFARKFHIRRQRYAPPKG